MPHLHVSLFSLTVALFGCSPAEVPHQQTAVDEAVLVATSTVVGVLEGEEFGNVVDIATRADGMLAVADLDAAAIRLFSFEGQLIRSLGRRGQGPGEFQVITAIEFVNDSVLAVRDLLNNRVSLITLEGEVLADQYVRPFEQASDRAMATTENAILMTVSSGKDIRLVSWAWADDRVDELGVIVPGSWFEECDRPFIGSSRAWVVPLSQNFEWTLLGDGRAAYGCSSEAAIRSGADGDVMAMVQSPPALISGGEREFRTEWLNIRASARNPGWRWGGEDIPETKPHFIAMFRGHAGDVWVQTSTPGEAKPRPLSALDVDPEVFYSSPFSAEVFARGEATPYLRVTGGIEIQLGSGTPSPAVFSGGMWAVTKGEYGEELVTLFEVVDSARGR